MDNRSTKILKTIKIIIGLLISGIGTAFLFDLGWGSAPAATITEGIAIFFKINYGPAGVIVNVIFLILLIILDRKLIGVGTILATFFFGYFIDVGVYILAPLKIVEMGMAMQVLMMLIGCILTAAGLGYYVGQFFGTGAMDGMSVIINRRTGIQFKYCRWTMDCAIMMIGVLLGAAWGVGTVASIVLTGPIMQFVINRVKDKEPSQKNRNRILKKSEK